MNVDCSSLQMPDQDPASRLAIEIQSLVKTSNLVAVTSERSVLFQVAAHLEIPELPRFSTPTPVITDENFALVRKEALSQQARKRSCAARARY